MVWEERRVKTEILNEISLDFILWVHSMNAIFLTLLLIFHISVLWFSCFKDWFFQLNKFINLAKTFQVVPTKIHLRKKHLVYEEFELPVRYKNTF